MGVTGEDLQLFQNYTRPCQCPRGWCRGGKIGIGTDQPTALFFVQLARYIRTVWEFSQDSGSGNLRIPSLTQESQREKQNVLNPYGEGGLSQKAPRVPCPWAHVVPQPRHCGTAAQTKDFFRGAPSRLLK